MVVLPKIPLYSCNKRSRPIFRLRFQSPFAKWLNRLIFKGKNESSIGMQILESKNVG